MCAVTRASNHSVWSAMAVGPDAVVESITNVTPLFDGWRARDHRVNVLGIQPLFGLIEDQHALNGRASTSARANSCVWPDDSLREASGQVAASSTRSMSAQPVSCFQIVEPRLPRPEDVIRGPQIGAIGEADHRGNLSGSSGGHDVTRSPPMRADPPAAYTRQHLSAAGLAGAVSGPG